MSNVQRTLPGVENWHAGQVELVCFPSGIGAILDHEWWKFVTGAEPTTTRKGSERLDDGPFRDIQLRLTTTPVRVAWTVAPRVDDPTDLVNRPPTIGPFIELLPWFCDAMRTWLRERSFPLNRLGLSATLAQFAPTVEDTYRLLGSYLPEIPVDPTSKDFRYQINRPRRSRIVEGLLINRLTAWSAIVINMQVEMKAYPVPAASAHTQKREDRACLLHLDINSAFEFPGQLPHGRLPDLLDELVELATEIASQGDIR